MSSQPQKSDGEKNNQRNGNSTIRLAIEKYSVRNKNPNGFSDDTINSLIKHENISILIDSIAIILCVIIYYLVAIHQIFLISDSYNYSLSVRESAVMAGYTISWVVVGFAIANIIRQFRFGYIVDLMESKRKSMQLTVDPMESSEKEKVDFETLVGKDIRRTRKMGDLPIERVYIRIISYIIIIVILIVAMYYYLPFNTLFPSFIEIWQINGRISVTDYFIFNIIMIVILGLEVMFYVFGVFGSISRADILRRIVFFRAQSQIFKEIKEELSNPSQEVDKSEPIIELQTNEIPQANQQKAPTSVKRMSVMNTPIEVLRQKKLEELAWKRKYGYLQEREKLLNLIEEGKLKSYYGKKGYKEYRKEQKSKMKLQSEKIEASKDINVQDVLISDLKKGGYDILNTESLDNEKNKTISQLTKQKVKETEKKLEEKKKKTKIKKSYDFR